MENRQSCQSGLRLRLWAGPVHALSASLAVKSTLLRYQSPTTGLFPTKTCGDDQKAKIHDSLYCAAAAWALALAYR